MILTAHALHRFAGCAEDFTDALNHAAAHWQIDTRERLCHWLAQLAHESGGFSRLEENLNYSADGLVKTFRKYFPSLADAAPYARQPEKIANCVYANRNGNGDRDSGDGWKFRGRGLIQITGRRNYQRCSRALFANDSLLLHPELLLEHEHAAQSAGWFWASNNLNKLADADDIDGITRAINGGLNGIGDRMEWLARAREVIA
ncbi:MAG: glycoside hydrolase family 19 protein [Gallionella sp.]|jgi:putative chitinase